MRIIDKVKEKTARLLNKVVFRPESKEIKKIVKRMKEEERFNKLGKKKYQLFFEPMKDKNELNQELKKIDKKINKMLEKRPDLYQHSFIPEPDPFPEYEQRLARNNVLIRHKQNNKHFADQVMQEDFETAREKARKMQSTLSQNSSQSSTVTPKVGASKTKGRGIS